MHGRAVEFTADELPAYLVNTLAAIAAPEARAGRSSSRPWTHAFTRTGTGWAGRQPHPAQA